MQINKYCFIFLLLVLAKNNAVFATVNFCTVEDTDNMTATVDAIMANASCDGPNRRLDESEFALQGSRRLDWGWYDCWKHFYCGSGVDISLATTGLVDEIRARWETGGDSGGDGILDSLQRLICDEGETSGTCNGGDENEAVGKPCQDKGLARPGCTSDTYWIGGFSLKWEVTKTEVDEESCDETHTVKLTFDDKFDPGFWLKQAAIVMYPELACCDLLGFKGEYHVKYTWYIKIVCKKTCAPTHAPTPSPSAPGSSPTGTYSTPSATSGTYSTPGTTTGTYSTSGTTTGMYSTTGTTTGTDSTTSTTTGMDSTTGTTTAMDYTTGTTTAMDSTTGTTTAMDSTTGITTGLDPTTGATTGTDSTIGTMTEMDSTAGTTTGTDPTTGATAGMDSTTGTTTEMDSTPSAMTENSPSPGPTTLFFLRG